MDRSTALAAVRHRRLTARPRLAATALIAAAIGLALLAAPASAAHADADG
ncbi:hypothetical protein SMC26_13945 [Actinomadura fulvescens]